MKVSNDEAARRSKAMAESASGHRQTRSASSSGDTMVRTAPSSGKNTDANGVASVPVPGVVGTSTSWRSRLIMAGSSRSARQGAGRSVARILESCIRSPPPMQITRV